MSTMKARERQLLKDAATLKEIRNSLEEDLIKMRNNNAVQDLQVKELQGELEVEQNFATLYKTQVTETILFRRRAGLNGTQGSSNRVANIIREIGTSKN